MRFFSALKLLEAAAAQTAVCICASRRTDRHAFAAGSREMLFVVAFFATAGAAVAPTRVSVCASRRDCPGDALRMVTTSLLEKLGKSRGLSEKPTVRPET
eukprot:gnl/TRDRNA2_/TRDRNA2_182487_c0_seq1.p2 gnl/TRDRNA2_/TRDRNA2_182487_c0~~gnl/TRDRNA2_/TRDRNA2_182487_c0_seq1.p2  ORF type:complete len:100 (+),score=7.91 gnl/TRDRNA2_/TRDRNA2_182487_c0_seq1:110-409(+)